jgi:anti-sigma B factor antagonist
MDTFAWQTWNSGPFSIERRPGKTQGTVILSLHGPFTVRDAYTNLSPMTLNKMFALEQGPNEQTPVKSILDLTECTSMDSSGLGMIATHLARCQSRNVKLIAAGLSPRVREVFHITKVDSIIPMTATVEEAESRE